MNRRERRANESILKNLRDTRAPRRIVAAMCFWQSNTPDGFSFELPFEGQAGDRFSQILHEKLLAVDALHTTRETALYDLRVVRGIQRDWSPGAPISSDCALSAFTIVAWLERHGHVKSDEHNGIAWIVQKGNAVLTLREDAPSPEAWAKAQQLIAAAGVPHVYMRVSKATKRQLTDSLLGRVTS